MFGALDSFITMYTIVLNIEEFLPFGQGKFVQEDFIIATRKNYRQRKFVENLEQYGNAVTKKHHASCAANSAQEQPSGNLIIPALSFWENEV